MREWLVTNGLGGYASLPISNIPSRKFHGLLISSLEPPAKRRVFVSNITDTITDGNNTIETTNNSNFLYDTHPTFTYTILRNQIKKTIFMPQNQNTTIIRYDIKTKKPLTITHTPIINSRHFYDTTNPDSIHFQINQTKNEISIKPNNTESELKIIIKNSLFNQNEQWIEQQYQKDKERNDSWIDHGYKIGDITKEINESMTYYLILTSEKRIPQNPEILHKKETLRKKLLIKNAALPHEFDKLILSTDNFIVKTNAGRSITAGYHWFGVWGRDTMISLPGIALIPQRYSLAKEILLQAKTYCKNGLIPNAIMDRDSVAVYNTVDASLWYIDRVFQYLKYTNDIDFLKEIWTTLQSIINGYKKGTLFGIRMDEDHLIRHDPGLTWMDVKIDDYYPTPRSNKAVEIQALWYNALKIMSLLSHFVDNEDTYSDLANDVKKSFNAQYNQQYDVIDTMDLSCRPNKIFLVSLDYQMIDKELQEDIVEDVKENLVTIFGLRTLSPIDSRYKGYYFGDYNRDITYHNGIVWPWLMGPFIKAFLKTKNYGAVWREYAYRTFLKPMMEIFGDRWDGNIHEIFDGDSPYAPRGCISQAWSVAEITRAWVEDIEGIQPKYENTFSLHEISI